MKNKKITQSDQQWINGYFAGFVSGEDHMLSETIRLLVKHRKMLRRRRKREGWTA